MKKIIISAFAFALTVFLSSSNVSAQTFNNPGEIPVVTITNASLRPCSGVVTNGCWKQSETAAPGEVIAVQIYYKNTSNTTAQNVSLYLSPKTTGTAVSVNYFGGVGNSVTNKATGNASLTLSSPATVTYMPGSARFYSGTSMSALTVDENELFSNNGALIGSVTPGSQGVVVVNFQVGQSQVVNPQTTYQCNDGIDNDSDGRTDYAGGDLSCTSNTDNTENTYDTPTNSCDANLYSSASSSYINSGGSVTLSWNTSGLSSLNIYPNVGSIANNSGSTIVYPTVSTVYTLSGYGCGNTYSRTVNVYVNATNPNPNTNLPQAVTTVATILSTTQARLNGIAVPNTTYGNATAWFEWGASGYMGNKTNTQTVNSSSAANTNISDVVGSLVPGTWYYYRTVVQNQNGIAYGDIQRFNTQPTTTTTTISKPNIVVVNTSKSQASLLELKIENSYDNACLNEYVDYTISYTNISKQNLKDTVLRFTNPKEVTYINNNTRGKYDVVDRTLTIDLGDLSAGENGQIIVRGRINSSAIENSLSVATATIVYTNTITKAQEDAMAYSLITLDNDCPNLLGASTVGFWSFLPNTLLEWLLLILVILGLIVLGRNLYTKKA